MSAHCPRLDEHPEATTVSTVARQAVASGQVDGVGPRWSLRRFEWFAKDCWGPVADEGGLVNFLFFQDTVSARTSRHAIVKPRVDLNAAVRTVFITRVQIGGCDERRGTICANGSVGAIRSIGAILPIGSVVPVVPG